MYHFLYYIHVGLKKRLESKQLAPSKITKPVAIAEMLLGVALIDDQAFYEYVSKHCKEYPPVGNITFTVEDNERIDRYIRELRDTRKKTLYVNTKEATSVVVHSRFFYLACDTLERFMHSNLYVDFELMVCDTGRPDKNFSTDVGLVEATSAGTVEGDEDDDDKPNALVALLTSEVNEWWYIQVCVLLYIIYLTV